MCVLHVESRLEKDRFLVSLEEMTMFLKPTNKGKRYRSKQEIISNVLQSIDAERGNGITKIIYGSYCSFIQAKEYLHELENIGLVTYDSDRRIWKITNKGFEFMRL